MLRQTDLEQEESVCAQHSETDTRGKTSDAQSPLVLQRRRSDRQSDGQKTPSHRLRRNWGLGLSDKKERQRRAGAKGPGSTAALPSLLFLIHESLPHLLPPECQPEPG